jgi:CysZ protein
MKAINYHIKGIIETFEQLSKGRYLLYFIPSILVTFIYAYFIWRAQEADQFFEIESKSDWANFIFRALDNGVSFFVDIYRMLLEQIYIFVALTLLSPVNTLLGEKLDERISGKKTKGGVIRFINDLVRMIFVVVIALFFELIFITFYLLIASILGFPEIMNSIFYFVIAAFFFGFAFYDFALERYAKGVFSSLGFAFSHPLGMIVLGSIFLAIYAIPWAGILLAPVLCIMISTVAYLYYTKQHPKLKRPAHE